MIFPDPDLALAIPNVLESFQTTWVKCPEKVFENPIIV
jgi:hypothetical protein